MLAFNTLLRPSALSHIPIWLVVLAIACRVVVEDSVECVCRVTARYVQHDEPKSNDAELHGVLDDTNRSGALRLGRPMFLPSLRLFPAEQGFDPVCGIARAVLSSDL